MGWNGLWGVLGEVGLVFGWAGKCVWLIGWDGMGWDVGLLCVLCSRRPGGEDGTKEEGPKVCLYLCRPSDGLPNDLETSHANT